MNSIAFCTSLAGFAGLMVCHAAEYRHRDVVNADFEAGAPRCADGWEIPAGTGWSVVDGRGINGTRALCYDGDVGAKERGLVTQWVEIDRSKKYLMEAWVRTEGLASGGASICVLCHDKDGSVFYGKYSSDRIVDSDGEWVKVSAVTGAGQFPDRAVRLSLCLFVQGTPKGKAYFDNVRLVPYEMARAPVAGIYSSAYRNSAVEGEVAFHAAINLPEKEFAEKRPSGVFCYVSAEGGQTCRKAENLSGSEASISVNVRDLALGTNPVSFELTGTDGAAIGRASLDFTRTEKPVGRRVYIDRFNRTIVNGKPFFPLGAYVGHIDWRGETNLSIYCQAPFNCILPYTFPQNKECLDLCQRTNLMVIASLYHAWAGMKSAWVRTEAEEEPFIRKIVDMCANHPATLAWYLYDELPASMLARLERRQKLMERLDPGHPTMGCVCQVDEMRDYLPTFDVVGSDPYPIGREHIKALPISMAGDWTRRTRDGVFRARAMWQIPQMFDWCWYSKGGTPKFPTYDEFRNMSYQCVAEGANGLVYYQFTRLMKEGETFSRCWPYVCAALREIAANIPVFLLDPGPAPASRSSDDLLLRTWRDGDSMWILAVNDTREPLSAEAAFANAPGTVAETAFGTAPKVDGNTLKFEMTPLACSLFRMKGAQRCD